MLQVGIYPDLRNFNPPQPSLIKEGAVPAPHLTRGGWEGLGYLAIGMNPCLNYRNTRIATASALTTPRSVINPVTNLAGVTSKP